MPSSIYTECNSNPVQELLPFSSFFVKLANHMNKIFKGIISILMLGSTSCSQADEEYPVETPRTEGYLQVSEKHQLYFATYGNPSGIPVVILHGGPGAGCKNEYTRFFDLKHWHVVMFDQRGAMRSIPFASMEENTLQDSVADIEALRKHLKIDKWALFGNSWGTCLGLVYGQTHPESCLGFILEGTFLGREKDIGFFRDLGKNSASAYQEFLTNLSSEEQKDFPNSCYKRLIDPSPDVHLQMARAIMRCLLLDSTNPPSPEIIENILSNDRYVLSCMRGIAHYAIHQCFLEPNQVIANMHKIAHLPAIIVHGSMDTVNLPEQAYLLHENWEKSRLKIVEGAGHSVFEPAIVKALAQGTNELIPQIK